MVKLHILDGLISGGPSHAGNPLGRQQKYHLIMAHFFQKLLIKSGK
jgi:hypothetical protein